MSLPSALKDTFLPQEIQFLTEMEKIWILPRYSMDSIELITDEIPQIRAMRRVEVPIWFAVLMKQQKKCSIIPPKWLSLIELNKLYSFEVTETEKFSPLPFNWLEICKIFFEISFDDLNDEVFKLKSLVQDLKEIRMIKIKKGLKLVNESHLQMDNLSLMEINEIRPFVVSVMSKLKDLNEAAKEEELPEGEEDEDLINRDDEEEDDLYK